MKPILRLLLVTPILLRIMLSTMHLIKLLYSQVRSIKSKSKSKLQFPGLKDYGPILQPLELASFFASLCGTHRLTVCPEESCVPSKSVQMRWLNSYLAAYLDLSLHEISMTQIEKLYRQVGLCTLLYLLRQTVWTLMMLRNACHKKELSEEVIRFGESRFRLYRKMKYNVMALEI